MRREFATKKQAQAERARIYSLPGALGTHEHCFIASGVRPVWYLVRATAWPHDGHDGPEAELQTDGTWQARP